MTAWSLNAYSLAVGLRSVKTILVEGATDKRVIARMLLDRELRRGMKLACVIDESALVSDDLLAGLGSRDRVERIAHHVGAESGRLNWLIDREWDDVDIDKPAAFAMPPPLSYGVRTKGHSIENYWFHEEALASFLKMFHAADLPAAFFKDLSERFQAMVKLGVAYSFAAKRLGLLSRCNGVIRAIDVAWNGSDYEVVVSLSASLAERNFAGDFASEVMGEARKVSLVGASQAVCVWLCHGHLGEELIRSCAANLALSHGCSPVTAQQIERGRRADKLAYDANYLVSIDPHAVEPLWSLIDWAE